MTFEEWFKDNMIIDDSLPNAPRVVFYTKEDIRAAWVAAEKATTAYFNTNYIIGVDMGDDRDYTAVTVSATPPCKHKNGWYNSIPGRFWGRQRVFVCTDCCDILEPENKKERV